MPLLELFVFNKMKNILRQQSFNWYFFAFEKKPVHQALVEGILLCQRLWKLVISSRWKSLIDIFIKFHSSAAFYIGLDFFLNCRKPPSLVLFIFRTVKTLKVNSVHRQIMQILDKLKWSYHMSNIFHPKGFLRKKRSITCY